jgi:tRNA G18 (ribose-2'-O)-methylase SpoU
MCRGVRVTPAIPITDADDTRIAPFREVRERDLVGREGCFIAEGEVVLRGLLRSRWHLPLAVLVAEHRLQRLAPLLAGVPAGVPIYAAAQGVMDAIAGFPMHRGVLALGRSGAARDPEELLSLLPRRALVMVPVGIANHDNMGGLFRNAAAFGVDAVLLDSGSCDPLYRKAIRVSVGAALQVPFARFSAGAPILDILESHGFEAFALSPGGAKVLRDVARPDRAALLFGTEGPGLPADLLARTEGVRIPMAGDFDSLNVATSSGIVLHHFAG